MDIFLDLIPLDFPAELPGGSVNSTRWITQGSVHADSLTLFQPFRSLLFPPFNRYSLFLCAKPNVEDFLNFQS